MADLHLGQIIYQHYDRLDEHEHFFRQLKGWISEFAPDALVVSGDIFDVQQPSAAVWRVFTDTFVDLHKCAPEMTLVITAGNHDSASRLQSHSAIWALADAYVIGTPPPVIAHDDSEADESDGNRSWAERFVIRLPKGYIVALPYMTGKRTATVQAILDYVAQENADGRPVVMTGHLAVTGCDFLGHDTEIGMLRTVDLSELGEGYDYLALGHIHRPQTLNHPETLMAESEEHAAPVARYSGSVLHVSCDETYPHGVSLVDIDRHGGTVKIRQLRIVEKRHFHILPADGCFASAEEALKGVEEFIKKNGCGYIRLRVDIAADLPSDFSNSIYRLIEESGKDVRYNPKVMWVGDQDAGHNTSEDAPRFELAELQQMTDPMGFITATADQYKGLDIEEIRRAFKEIEEELSKD